MCRVRVLTQAILVILGYSLVSPIRSAGESQSEGQEREEEGSYETVTATSTRWGETGFFDVFSAYTVRRSKIAVSTFRDNIDRETFNMDISNFSGNFAVGISDRVELFGRFDVQRRIHATEGPVGIQRLLHGGSDDPCLDPEIARDVDPQLFLEFCGLNPDFIAYPPFYNDEPRVFHRWATGVGDAWLGGKWNLLSEYRDDPVALALRGFIKLPTADANVGLGTGAFSGGGHVVISKNLGEHIESSYYAGFRGNANGDIPFNLGNAIEWGLGTSFPRKSMLRGMVELTGSVFTGADPMYRGGTSVEQPNPVDLLLGLNIQMEGGFFVSAGWRTNFNFDVSGETASGFNFRIGYHPGVRGKYIPPPPTPPAVNHPPSVTVRVDPPEVEEGTDSTVTADASDPDGDPLTFAWRAPDGRITGSGPRVTWTAPTGVEGSYPVTVTVDDGQGETASDTTSIRVHRKVVRVIDFEDLHFLFDRYDLTEDARRILDQAAAELKENIDLNIEIEGHCCSIGTEEYNLSLGARRANAVKDYLIRAGVGESRLQTTSYGESRPAHDNSREVTRKLNRRSHLRVLITR
jgi:outer membrane protein OmpA-like peptidoglycan-associated protein